MTPGRPHLAVGAWPTRLLTGTGAGAAEASPSRLSSAYVGRLDLPFVWRSVWQAATVGAVLWLLAFWLIHGVGQPVLDSDGAAYWSSRAGPLYPLPWLSELQGLPHPYVYSPAFAQLIRPLTIWPLPVFMALWTGIQMAMVGWLAGPVLAVILLALFQPLSGTDVMAGSLYVPMAFFLALSLRWPAAWSFQLLSKVTPGVGLLWHVGQRDWRGLAIAVGFTALVTLVSFVIWPAAWFDWVGLLRQSAGLTAPDTLAVPLIVRLSIAAGLALLAGWRGWRPLLAVAVVLAMPQVGWSSCAVLLAAVYWWRRQYASSSALKMQ